MEWKNVTSRSLLYKLNAYKRKYLNHFDKVPQIDQCILRILGVFNLIKELAYTHYLIFLKIIRISTEMLAVLFSNCIPSWDIDFLIIYFFATINSFTLTFPDGKDMYLSIWVALGVQVCLCVSMIF